MSDYISREAASTDKCKHKIKTPFARIVVEGTPEKPYYNILHFDPADGECHIGFGSYCRDNVFRWLAEEFEITEPAADVEPVRRWIPCSERLPGENVPVLGWYKDNPFASYCPEIVSWNGKGWVFVYAQRYVTDVTHWMPLPEQPEEGDAGNGLD